MTESENCAVWYWRYHGCYVRVFSNETLAATWALDLEDRGDGSVEGVQYPDGRAVKSEEWPLYQELQRAQWETPLPVVERGKPPVTRKVANPFGRGEAIVDEVMPSWVGPPKGETHL